MNERFAEWYMIANPSADHDIVSRRWEAVEKVASEIEVSTVFELARGYHGLASKDTEFSSIVVEAIRAADASFVAAGREFEIAILTGVVLCEALANDDDDVGDVAAFSIIVPNLHGLRKAGHLPQLLDIAEQHIADRSKSLRAPKRVSNAASVSQESINTLAASIAESQFPAAAENLKKVISLQNNVLISQAKRIHQLEVSQLLLREESDILWWLTGLHSRIANRPFAQIDIGLAALLMGRELADLTRVSPGPLSINALINRMLRGSYDASSLKENIPLASSINSLDADIRTLWTSESRSLALLDLCPIYSAIVNSTSVEKSNDWLPLFKKAQAVDPKGKLSASSLGRQMYFESLFLRMGT